MFPWIAKITITAVWKREKGFNGVAVILDVEIMTGITFSSKKKEAEMCCNSRLL